MKILLHYFLCIVLFISCSSEKENRTEVEVPPTKQVELPPTQTPGKLVALLENSVTSYYINKGYPRGFEYEMLSLFCKDHDLELDIRMVHNMDQLFDSLTDGSADILAANITVTGERKNFVSFSNPILRTRQVLIQRLPEGYKRMSSSKIKKRIVNDALDLEGRTVHVHNNTSYMTQLKNYVNSNGMNVNIVAIDPEEGIDDLIAEVAEGKYDFTILDENIASIYKKIYPNLHISTPISLSQNIAWAVKKDNARLLEMINQWQEENRGSTRWNMIYNKYFKYTSSEVKYLQNHISDLKTGELTPYDPLIQKYANQIEWDWRLLASLIRRESRFNSHAHSPFGAQGLMQVLPTTAGRFGVTQEQLFIPEYNIIAGTRFLQWLEHFWSKHLPDTISHKEYILASYNAGPGHVLDAMNLAEKNGFNPHVWNDNVELMLLYKSKPAYYRDPVVKHGYCRGKEPVHYVKDIQKYYEYYKVYTDKSPDLVASVSL